MSAVPRKVIDYPTQKGNGSMPKPPAHPRGNRNGAGRHSQKRIRRV